jgi:hypothetical protein
MEAEQRITGNPTSPTMVHFRRGSTFTANMEPASLYDSDLLRAFIWCFFLSTFIMPIGLLPLEMYVYLFIFSPETF